MLQLKVKSRQKENTVTGTITKYLEFYWDVASHLCPNYSKLFLSLLSPPHFLPPPVLFADGAIQFTREPKSQDALHGRSAMLRCEVSDPADVSYSWLHDGRSLESSERRFQEGSNLKFIAVDRQLDAGNFVCVARNAATGEELRSTNASFNIKCELSLFS